MVFGLLPHRFSNSVPFLAFDHPNSTISAEFLFLETRMEAPVKKGTNTIMLGKTHSDDFPVKQFPHNDLRTSGIFTR
jgi:hypothetical protein